MKTRRFGLAAFVLVSLSASAAAQQGYAQSTQNVRAGNLLIASARVAGQPDNPTPHVWFNLDMNRRVKPTSWNIYNPRASTVMDASTNARWTALAGVVGGAVPAVGSTLRKRDASYWEVPLLTASEEQLQDYDVLLLSAYGTISLNPIEREKLRTYVDHGGLLWIDVNSDTATAGLDTINNFPIPFLMSTAGASVTADYFSPLMSSPYSLSSYDLQNLQSDTTSAIRYLTAADLTSPVFSSSLPYDSLHLLPVAGDSTATTIAVGKEGDGYIVVTARGIARTLNRARTSAGVTVNNQFTGADSLPDRVTDSAAKLVVNMLNLSASYSEFGQGPRKQSSTFVDVQAPVLARFNAPANVSGYSSSVHQPAVFKGLLVVTTDTQVLVYDAKPQRDLDGDGDSDDGFPDLNSGTSYDLVWASEPLVGPLSGAACLTVPQPGSGIPKDQIMVVDAVGHLHVYDAMPTSGGLLLGPTDIAQVYELAPPAATDADLDLTVEGAGPFTPTVHNGLVYVSDTVAGGTGRVGRVWAMDPSTGDYLRSPALANAPWYVGGTGSAQMKEISGSPTVGYVPIQDNSGGQDLVMYVPTRPNPSGGGPDSTCGITSLWMGAKGERPTDVQVSGTGNQLIVTTRASIQGLRVFTYNGAHPMGIKLSVIDSNTGDPLTEAQLNGIFANVEPTQSPDGVLTFDITAGTWLANYSLRIDYYIDWGVQNDQVVRGTLFFPDSSDYRRVLGSPAMGPTGITYVVVSDTPGGTSDVPGGALYAFREEGRGTFRLIYRYDMYDTHTIVLNQTGPVTYRPTFINEDPLTTMPGVGPILSGDLSNLTFTGPPSVRNGTVFATASGIKPGLFNVDMTVLMAFDANPEPARIRVGGVGDNFSIVQPDFARSNVPSSPDIFTVLQPTQFVYEKDNAGDTGTIRFNSLMASNRGVVQQALNTSGPIIIRRSGQPDQLIEPDRNGGRWSPLQWYYIMHGTSSISGPMVTGDSVFVAGNSFFPDILSGVFPPTTMRGVFTALKAEINPAEVPSNSVRPWMHQVYNFTIDGAGIKSNPKILWPQTAGVTSFEDWQVRYLQTTLPSSSALGIVAGDGALFAWSDFGIHGYAKANLLVADEGRLAKLDPSGNPKWITNASENTGATGVGSAGNVRALVRPVRAYPIGESDVLAVDPGSNRIARLDDSGHEIRSIDGFILDNTRIPDGYQANEIQTLNNPMDVAVYTSYEANPPLTNSQPLEYWIHYLIADQGNNRLIELVDRFIADPTTRALTGVVDVGGTKQYGVLWWHSPSNVSGKDFPYNSVDRVWDPVGGAYVYVAGFGRTTPTRSSLGLTPGDSLSEASTGNGGIVVFNDAGTNVINRMSIPAIAANVFYNPATGMFDANGRPARTKAIGDISSVTIRYLETTGGPLQVIMFTDASGVYEITDNGSETANVIWMLPVDAFTVMRRAGATIFGSNPRNFRPTYARRLDSGDILIVNGFTGRTRDNTADYTGEILELDGSFDPSINNALPGFDFSKTNLGFSNLSIRFQLSTVQGARNITLPVFADLR